MAEEKGRSPEPSPSWTDTMEEIDSPVYTMILTNPSEILPATLEPHNLTLVEGPQNPESIYEVMNYQSDDLNLTELGRNASSPLCLEKLFQESSNTHDPVARTNTPGPQDDSDWTSTEHDSDEGGIIGSDLWEELVENRNLDCYFPGEEYRHWKTRGKYPYTSYRCLPGDRMVVDVMTGGARVVPSLSYHIYGTGKPPIDKGLAPNEELMYQCPDDVPLGRELDGWALYLIDSDEDERTDNRESLSPPGALKVNTRPRDSSPGGPHAGPSATHQQPGHSLDDPRRSRNPRRAYHGIPKVARDVTLSTNRLLWYRGRKWSSIDGPTLKAPRWVFEQACGLRLGPQGWKGSQRYIWPLDYFGQLDHLLPVSTQLGNIPALEGSSVSLIPGVIPIARKLYLHNPTKKLFCLLESGDGQHTILVESPSPPYIWPILTWGPA